MTKKHSYSETITKYPYIRVTDFNEMSVNVDGLKYLRSETQKLINKYTISKGDLYISIAGSIGKVGLIPDQLDGANLTENAAKICSIKGFNKKFLCYFLNSTFAQEQIERLKTFTNQPKLALFRIEQIICPFLSIQEQLRIVEIIEFFSPKPIPSKNPSKSPTPIAEN